MVQSNTPHSFNCHACSWDLGRGNSPFCCESLLRTAGGTRPLCFFFSLARAMSPVGAAQRWSWGAEVTVSVETRVGVSEVSANALSQDRNFD